MSRKGPRGLTHEEQELWNKVTQKASPMHPERPEQIVYQINHPRPKPPKPGIKPFQIGERHTATALPHNLASSISDHVKSQPVRMDSKSFGQMKRGKLKPEARIDLHGMTLDRAHPALNRFIMGSHAKGLRLVLVITGKGKSKSDDGPIPVRRGVLKNQVPHWLATPPLNTVVLQVTEAHLKHGGQGAYYVYLRRQR